MELVRRNAHSWRDRLSSPCSAPRHQADSSWCSNSIQLRSTSSPCDRPASNCQARAASAVTSPRVCRRSSGNAFAYARRACRLCVDPQNRDGQTIEELSAKITARGILPRATG